LQVLFLGRLDRQKGIDRLAAVIEGARARDLPMAWRIIGAPTLDALTLPAVIRDLAAPPVIATDELTGLFAWADILLLLSDFEGVPLTILEAQRLGVCVIATDVGAVAEVIAAGRTGLLVQPETAVAETLALLQTLGQSPRIAWEIGQAAAAARRDWAETTEPLVTWLESRVRASRPSNP
jgi:glycosyltransferase involved in cell wall biosynthesis